ncbi:metallophosphoesterase [Fluviicola taffensis]|uniref:Metallophosphoesterase n=1 Tax=Fluviicola taffensis (strain DSM 16823 / NCIMB 13979 / RW262) TaxID=755732 RepID=F2IA42_FLUTR|nr:metallophosphoesterase [Fluviicola taffensis]AEA45219.1 metallophosphoesterase [Fluviicola taffensis DSM 16823]
MRTFVIGDIHGCFDELIELTEKIQLKEDDLLISLGDIVDRGNKSKEVYDYFKSRPNSLVLIGNHERKHQNKILSYSQEIVKVQFGDEYESFLNWLDTLGYYYETADAIIVHAFFEHDKVLADQKQEVLSGSTSGDRYLEKKYPGEKYWSDFYTGSKPIIYGHHVVGTTPKIFNNTYGIDTGACHGDYLTAIELPGFIIHQVKAKRDYWKDEQKQGQIPVLKAKNWNEMRFSEIDKQLNKLAYIEEEEVVSYLLEIRTWKEGIQNSFETIKDEIDKYTKELMEIHQDNFTLEANKKSFKTYLFKSRSNNLTLQDLQKGLNTPAKIEELRKELESK